MELMAAIKAIQKLPIDTFCRANLYTDSQYVESTVNSGKIYKDEDNDFDDVVNGDLWAYMHYELSRRPHLKINFIHIDGHQKDLENPLVLGNHIADELADYKSHKVYLQDLEK